ncbi:hypothetical protein B0H13DRAFT_2347067 [Mycena leptocephala]|nr:hypothetical protein B0H13DRAFT_2347067 [Mycena leptocephala]
MDVDQPEIKSKKSEKHALDLNGTRRAKDLQAVQDIDEGVLGKPAGRQSDVQNTVNLPSIINRILDLTVPMTVREAVVASREIRTGIMDTIRLKNVKAVLIGRLPGNALVANWNWPRSEVDTGSQLDVVRADVAALKIQKPVDMSRVTSMNDANGGRGKEKKKICANSVQHAALAIQLLSYKVAYLSVEYESVERYKAAKQSVFCFRNSSTETDFGTHLLELTTDMPTRSAPVSPALPRYVPRPFLREAGGGRRDRGTPLVSPLTSLPAGILDRTRKGSFGPEDPHPREASVMNRVQAAADEYWIQHRRGNEPTETFHAILLNARLLIHNPRTGEPGAINGHATVQLHAVPSNDRVWNLEVPYASDQQIQETLTNYGTGVHREIRQDESSSDESSVSGGWRARPIHAPVPTYPINVQGIDALTHTTELVNSAQGYVTHPDGNVPPFDTSRMREIGRTPSGDHVLQFPDPSESVAGAGGWSDPELPDCREVLEENNEIFKDLLSELWTTVTDVWTSQNSAPVDHRGPSNGLVERVCYDARACNWMREESTAGKHPESSGAGVEKETTVAARDVEEEEIASSSDELEEGELRVAPRVADPRLQSRADAMPIPAIGSGRRGAVITRSNYSSSASPVSTNDTATSSFFSHQSVTPSQSPLSIVERFLEAERVIAATVYSVATANSLFDFEDDSDSPPELLEEDSSDEHTSSAEELALTKKFVTVRTTDCLEALAQMRRAAPTPDRNPEVRSVAMDDLEEWCRRQVQLQEGVRCSENHRALFPLREALEIVRLYLEDIIDRDAMALEARGYQSWPMALANSATQVALESVSEPAGDGKRKICNEFILAVACDNKRLRRLGGEALTWEPARCAGLYAEGVRLQDYLAPLINLRGFVLSCMGQLNALAVRRQYSIDMSHVNQNNDTLTPVLDWGERAKLTCLQYAFASTGQTDVASQLDTFLKLRFCDARILARLLYANVFDAEDYTPVTVDDEAVRRDLCAAECMLSSATNYSESANARFILPKPCPVFLDSTIG